MSLDQCILCVYLTFPVLPVLLQLFAHTWALLVSLDSLLTAVKTAKIGITKGIAYHFNILSSIVGMLV
jgi:hypothetical protein